MRLWSQSGFRVACVLMDTWRIRTPFPFYETRNPIVPLCLSPQHSSEHILRPSGLTFGLQHFELFCLTCDPPPHPAPSPTLTLYGKGSWGMSVNGTWLKKIYICIYKHAAFFCTWICIFNPWSPEEWPESFVIAVVMCAWKSVPKPSVLAESCLST